LFVTSSPAVAADGLLLGLGADLASLDAAPLEAVGPAE
ncbi:MAG: hypothetical protein QOG69_1346, partial [Actinomycetota bacterium]|nr:hypothetical protein [Actinomycetota bacterium]